MEEQHREQSQQQQLQQHRAPPPNSWTPPHTPPHSMGGAGVTELSSAGGGVVGTSPQRWCTTSSRAEGRGVPRKLVSYGRSPSTLPSILRSSSPLLGAPLSCSKKISSKGTEVCVPVSSLAASAPRPSVQGAPKPAACTLTGTVLSSQPYVAVVSKSSASSSPAGLAAPTGVRASTASSVSRTASCPTPTASRPAPTASRPASTASSGTRTATSVRVWLSSASNSPAAVRSTSSGALVLPSGFDMTKLYPELSKLGVVKSTSSSNGTTVLTSINSNSSSNINNNNNNNMHTGDAVFSSPSEVMTGRNRLNSQNINSFRNSGSTSPSAALLTSSAASSSTPPMLCGTSTSVPRLDGCTHTTINAGENLSFRTSTSASFPNVTLANSIISSVKVSQSSSNLVNFIKIGGSTAQVKGLMPVSGGDIRQARLLPDGRIVGIRAADTGCDRIPSVSPATRGLCNGASVGVVSKSTASPPVVSHNVGPASTSGVLGSIRSGAGPPGVGAAPLLPCVNTRVVLPSAITSAATLPVSVATLPISVATLPVSVATLPVSVATLPASNGTSVTATAGVFKHNGTAGKRGAAAAAAGVSTAVAAAASRSSVEEAELQARSKQLQLQKQLEQIHGGLSRAGNAGPLAVDASVTGLPVTTVKQFRLSPKQVASLLSQATLSPTSLTVVSRASLLPPQSVASVASGGVKRKASPATPARSCKSLKSSAPLATLHPSQGISSHLSTNLVSNISTSSPSCTLSNSALPPTRNGLSVLTRAKVSSILKNVSESAATVPGCAVEPASVAGSKDAGSLTEHKSVLQQRRVSFKPVAGDAAPDRRNYSRKPSNSSAGATKPVDQRVEIAVPGSDATAWAALAATKTGSCVYAPSHAGAWRDVKPALVKATSDDVKPSVGRGNFDDLKPTLGRSAGSRWRVLRAHPGGRELLHGRPPMAVQMPAPVQRLHDLLLERTALAVPSIVPHSLLDLDECDPRMTPCRLWLRDDGGVGAGSGDVKVARLSVAPQRDISGGCHTDALLAARVASISPFNSARVSAAMENARHRGTVASEMLAQCRKRHTSSVACTAALIKAARHNPRLTAATVAHFNPHLSLQGLCAPRSSAAQRSCLLEKTTCVYELSSSSEGSAPCPSPGLCEGVSPSPRVCGAPALPGTRHCMRHITYNVDQQIFVQCCARSEARGAMCRVPVLCLADQPLCAAHRHCAADDHAASRPSSPSTSTPSSSSSTTTRRCRRKGKVPTSCRYGKRKRRRSTTPHSASAIHSSGKGGGKGTGKGKGGGSGKVVPSTAVRPPMNNGLVLPSGGYHHLLPSSPPHSPFSVAACSECGDSAACCCPAKEEEADDLDGSLDASLELPGNVVAAASRLLDPQHLHDLLLEEEQHEIFPPHCSVAPDVKVEANGNCSVTPGMSSADVFSLGCQHQLPAMQQSGSQQLQQCAADAGLTAAALDSYASVMDANNPIDSMISSSFNQQELNVITQFLGNIVDQDVLMMQQPPPTALGMPPVVGSTPSALDGIGVYPHHTSCGNNPPLSFFDNALVGDACISQSLASSASSACPAPASQLPITSAWNGTHFSASCTSSPYVPPVSVPPVTSTGLLDMYCQTKRTSETGVAMSGTSDVPNQPGESNARKAESLQDSASQFSIRDSEEYSHSGGLNVPVGGDMTLGTSSAASVGYSLAPTLRGRDVFDACGQVVTTASAAPVTGASMFVTLGVPQYNVNAESPRAAASLLASSDSDDSLALSRANTVPLTSSDAEVPTLLRAASDVSASPAPDCLESNPGSFSQLPSPSMPPTPSDDDMTSVVEFPSPTASDPSLTDIDTPADIRRTPEHMEDCKPRQQPLLYQPPDCRILPPGFRLMDTKVPAPRLH